MIEVAEWVLLNIKQNYPHFIEGNRVKRSATCNNKTVSVESDNLELFSKTAIFLSLNLRLARGNLPQNVNNDAMISPGHRTLST